MLPPPDYSQSALQTLLTLPIAVVCFPLCLLLAFSQADCEMVYFWLRKCDFLYPLFLSGGNAMTFLT